jgi:hypothetical protein
MARAALLLALALPAGASAQDDARRWRFSAEGTVTDQSGNRSLRLLTAGITATHLQRDELRFDAAVRTRYGESQREVVARNHFASLAVDLHPRRRWTPFLYTDLEHDAIRRIRLRTSGGAGAKHTFVRDEGSNTEASLSAALLYEHERRVGTVAEPAPPDRRLARWSLRARGRRPLGTGASLQHVTFWQPAAGEMADYLLRSETGAKVLLRESLALTWAYEFRRTSLPPADVERDDRLLKAGLIVDF